MQTVHFRVDQELYEQLQDIADAEREPLAVIVRRAVRKGMPPTEPVRERSSAHEGNERVR